MFNNVMMGAFVLFLIWMMIGFFEQLKRKEKKREEDKIKEKKI